MNRILFIFVLCILYILPDEYEARRIPNWFLKIAHRQGPNTCAVEEIPEKNVKVWTECKYWMNRDVCGYKTIIRYECCEGYFQISGTTGCRGVRPITNVLETLRHLGATKFVEFVERHDNQLAARLSQMGGAAVTVFAPTNKAFEEMGRLRTSVFKNSLHDLLSSHLLYHVIADQKITSTDLENADNLVETMLEGRKLRINRYSNGMLTVNCIPVVRKDQTASNGIIHLLDGVLSPAAGRSDVSIPEALIADGRFREFTRILLRSPFVNELRDDGPYTLLIPHDEAFQKRHHEMLKTVLKDEDSKTMLLRNHVIPNVICPSAITREHHIATLDGQKIDLNCNKSGTFINDVKITGEVISTQNGILAVVGDMLIPDKVRSWIDVLGAHPKLKRLHALIKSAHLEDTLEENVTFFAPSDKAIQSLALEEQQKLTNDKQYLLSLLLHHSTRGISTTRTMTDGQRLGTLDGQGVLRIKVYRKAFGVESAILEESNIDCRNGIVHIINKVLQQPSLTTMDFLQQDSNFSIFQEAIRRVREHDPSFLSKSANDTLTIFAPTNRAFQELDDLEFQSLMEDTTRLEQVLQHHVVEGMISSSSVHYDLQYEIPTENRPVKVRLSPEGKLVVDDAKVLAEDMVTTNGIIHCIDKVLIPNHIRKFREENMTN